MQQRTRNRPEQDNTPQAMAPAAGRTDWTAASQAASAGDQAIENVLGGWDASEYQASTRQEGGQ